MTTETNTFEVVIVGAGPVGLLLANLLGQAGIRTLVADRRERGPEASMAIGITPPSLRILQALDLDEAFVARGVKVGNALVHGDRRKLAELSFAYLAGGWPYILSLPQAETVRLLEEKLTAWPCVELRRGLELAGFSQDEAGVDVDLQGPEGDALALRATYLVGCDGRSGAVRDRLQLRRQHYLYPQTFLMADHRDRTELGSAAALWFTRRGSVESFPLPDGRRRWIVQTDRFEEQPAGDLLERLVGDRAGIVLDPADKGFESPFRVNRLLVEHFVRGRVVVCGDAAHLMSPVGGQGMNVGFGDARHLAATLQRILRQDRDATAELTAYDHARRPAASTAIARAERGMFFGTRRGIVACLWRGLIIRLLFLPGLRNKLPPYFAMTTLPGRSLPPGHPR